MSKIESIARYNLIINKLRKRPCPFCEISDFLKAESELQEYNFSVSKRTFQRDLEDIRSLYGIDIYYDHSKAVYCIDNEGNPELNERIMEAFDVLNALRISERLSDVVFFENRRPRGTENLYSLLQAVKNNVRISFLYCKFNDEQTTLRTAEPYALKEFRNRWYVLARDMDDGLIKSFSLDRLSHLETLKQKFKKPEGFDVEKHFRNCFGIISPNGDEPSEVILSFSPLQGKYIKTLPLHQSQQILKDNEEELRIKLSLFVTYDFIMELLSFGANVKVVEPMALRNELRQTYDKARSLYK